MNNVEVVAWRIVHDLDCDKTVCVYFDGEDDVDEKKAQALVTLTSAQAEIERLTKERDDYEGEYLAERKARYEAQGEAIERGYRAEAVEKERDALRKELAITRADRDTFYHEANALAIEVDVKREALKPFAQIAEDGTMIEPHYKDTDEWFRFDGAVLTVGDFRRAVSALQPLEPKNDPLT